MQGQRSIVNPLPEAFDFDDGSSSGHAVVGQCIWNYARNPVESKLPNYILSPSETNITYGNAVGHDGLSLGGWSLGESSSTENARYQDRCDELKMDHEHPSSSNTCAGSGLVLEERRYETTDILSLESASLSLSSNQVATGPLFLQSQSSDCSSPNLNLNAGHANNSSNGVQVMGPGVCPHPYKLGKSEAVQIPSAGDSCDPYATNSGSLPYLVEGNDSRQSYSLDSQRLSCKRKACEGASGQSYLGGSSSSFQQAENSRVHSVPAHHSAGNSLNISIPSDNPPVVHHQEQLNPVLSVGVVGMASDNLPAVNIAGNVANSRRNFRMRMNPTHQQDAMPPNLLSTGSSSRRSQNLPQHQSSRFPPFNNSVYSRATAAVANRTPQGQSHVQPFPWNEASNSEVGMSSSFPVISGERDVAFTEDPNSRNMSRITSEHPMFAPTMEIRNFAQDPSNWSLGNGNSNIPGNFASTSVVGSSSSVRLSPLATWVPRNNSRSQYAQRLSEFVRHSLFPSAGVEGGGQINRLQSLHSGPSGSAQVGPSAGAGQQGNHQPYRRSALWMERHGDGVLSLPNSLRTRATSREGRIRLATQIRNALDLMRRSENLQFEDISVLDQSGFFGMADLHDRHRDLRLDVDNMSYEELLALEERIGNVSTGLSEENILKCLKQKKKFSITNGAPLDVEPCCICQEDYVDGEDLGTLGCGHDFHRSCIKQWLMNKNLCPICKTTALDT